MATTESSKTWTAVVVACQSDKAVTATQQELRRKQKLGIFAPGTIVLAIEDPQQGEGSGGATLNALLVVAEHISAKRNYSVVNPDVLQNSKILIFHLGKEYAYEPCGRPFLPLPVVIPGMENYEFLPTNLDALYYLMTEKIAVNSPAGVWVCGTDMLLDLPNDIPSLDLSGVDVCMLSVPATVKYATRHGAFKLSPQGDILDIIFHGSPEQLEPCVQEKGHISLVTGVTYFSVRVADTLLGFHTMPPLDTSTYLGIDSGAKPIRLSLIFDILLAMCSDITEADFVSGCRGDSYGMKPDVNVDASMTAARHIIWKYLRHFVPKIYWIPQGRHMYLEDTVRPIPEIIADFGTAADAAIKKVSHSHCFSPSLVQSISVVNSIIEDSCNIDEGTIVINSNLTGDFNAHKNCYISGIDTHTMVIHHGTCIEIPDFTVLLSINIRANSTIPKSCKVLLGWGLLDRIYESYLSPESTFFNKPWNTFFQRTRISPEELWSTETIDREKSFVTAKLFPLSDMTDHLMWMCGTSPHQPFLNRWRLSQRLSLIQILSLVDHDKEFSYRRSVFHEISKQKIRTTLLGGKGQGLTGLYRAAVNNGMADDILLTLDDIASSCGSPGIAARTLANIAGVLGAMARGKGGLRSGPAANHQWAEAFRLLECEDIAGGIHAMAKERENWIAQPELLVRASRHYEGAAQILIRHAVMTARQFIGTVPCERPGLGQWVVVESPARVDIAGGWSDTPPITYEHGGAVINAAITLDGKRPIGAKVRRISEPKLVLHIGTSDAVSSTLVLTDLDQMADYNNPQAQGALLKAAFFCAEILELSSGSTLTEQLSDKYQGGYELYSWSNLPHGSGLGASSILAGAIMAALWRSSGQQFDIDGLNHAVAHLEQMLTTGGGWQDQVGGLTGGIKVGHSAPSLPMRIEMAFPIISPNTVKAFSDRLILVYTGKTRLARNLLQNVLRNWFARDPEIVRTEDELVSTAWKCAKAFEQGDLETVGGCMNYYWALKKKMAPGCEPESVTAMMTALRPHTLGLCMAGAGGGGFLYILTKEAFCRDTVQGILSTLPGIGNVSVHASAVVEEGLVISVQDHV